MTESTELATVELASVPALFTAGGTTDILDKIEAEALALVADPTTDKGRKAIASNAAKVARSKTYLDGLGKDLAAGLKEQTKAIDKERRTMRQRLDDLKVRVRKPLTDFEDREKARIAEIMARVDAFNVDAPPDLPGVLAMIEKIKAIEIDDSFMEFKAGAERAKGSAMWLLTTAKAHHAARIAEEKARGEREKQARIEREARIAKEARERAEAKAKADTQRAAAAAVAAKERAIADERERARVAAEAQSRRIEAAKEKAHADYLAREAKLKADASTALADVRREMEARAAEEKEKAVEKARRIAEEKATKLWKEQARIDAERPPPKVAVLKSSKAKVNREILARLVDLGAEVNLAKRIITQMAHGKIPHVSINYGGAE